MLAAALIVFREVLEAALVVTIIMAATRGAPGRGLWVSLGVGAGTLGAGLVAALTATISAAFEGNGHDVLNAAILFTAVLLIGWHAVWMSSHGQKLAAEMRAVGKSVSEGDKHMSLLAIVVGLAVMREGSELVLMLQGLWATNADPAMLTGMGAGLFAGVLASGLLYAGFIALPVARMFSLTNGILVLIAAGMAARGANFLVQAGLVPSLGARMWDTSALLSDHSTVGQVLAALTGYIARPSGIEVLFYAATILVVAILMLRAYRQMKQTLPMAAALVLFCVAPMHARADEVLSPYVVKGEAEIEHQGYIAHDTNPDASGAQAIIAELGYSPTSFWRTEFEAEFETEAGPDQIMRQSSYNTENTFQLAEPGEYWIDPGLFYEMDFAREGPNNIIFGFLGAKNLGMFMETFNLLAHKDYGPGNTAMGFIYSNQFKYKWRVWLEPGFEIFGDTDGMSRFQDQQLAIGPGLFGKIYTFNGQALKYEAGMVFGATPATPDRAVRWKLEYEFYF